MLTSILVETDEALSRFASPLVDILSISIAQQGALGEASLGVVVVPISARGGVVAVIATRSWNTCMWPVRNTDKLILPLTHFTFHWITQRYFNYAILKIQTSFVKFWEFVCENRSYGRYTSNCPSREICQSGNFDNGRGCFHKIFEGVL